MILLGIDPGTARMGYAVLKYSSKPELIETSTIITKPELEMPQRLKVLYTNLNDVIKINKPDIIVVERLFFNTNVKTAMAVGQSRGVVLLVAADWGVNVVEYTALEAKKHVAGYGRAKKKEMQEAVRDILGLSMVVKSDDANDAVAMALCHLKKEFVDSFVTPDAKIQS